jgi:hypothetical protein
MVFDLMRSLRVFCTNQQLSESPRFVSQAVLYCHCATPGGREVYARLQEQSFWYHGKTKHEEFTHRTAGSFESRTGAVS